VSVTRWRLRASMRDVSAMRRANDLLEGFTGRRLMLV
jgi:hypothetical protein